MCELTELEKHELTLRRHELATLISRVYTLLAVIEGYRKIEVVTSPWASFPTTLYSAANDVETQLSLMERVATQDAEL